MKILCFGSLNIDLVYRVQNIVRPGETIACNDLQRFGGGKGANQSLALGRAGASVYHAGKIGTDGDFLLDILRESKVNTDFVLKGEANTGHAIIQVDDSGENSIVIFPGTNGEISCEDIDKVLANFEENDILLIQNEISNIAYLIESAHKNNMKVCFNPAPFSPEITALPLNKVSLLIVNETEAEGISGKSDINDIIQELNSLYPETELIMTLGADGAMYSFKDETISVPGKKVKAVDTTAAGDTFIGYYLAETSKGASIKQALNTACLAASITVARPGAMNSIPFKKDLSFKI